MGQKHKIRASDKIINLQIKKSCGKYFPELVDDLPDKLLLIMGKRVCPTDFAVCFYYNKNHKAFYLNMSQLRCTVRRAWEIGAFDHRQQLLDILVADGRILQEGDDF